MSLRRKSRELALQVLFQKEFSQDIDLISRLPYFKESFPEQKNEVWSYAEVLIQGIVENLDSLDDEIKSLASNWKKERMALVDVNILRVAIYEIKFLSSEIPPKVAINEALEISKKYSNSDSPQFINGILGKLI